MHDTTAREKILKRIRNAGLVTVENPYSGVNQDSEIYSDDLSEDLLIVFAEQLNNIGGSFVYCENREEFVKSFVVLANSLHINRVFSGDDDIQAVLTSGGVKVETDKEKITSAELIVTGCEALVARTGSVVVSSRRQSGRAANFFPEIHVVVASPNQVVATVKDAVNFLIRKYNRFPSMVSFITGPSRTADIEKTLVMGAHGPRKLMVFVVENL